MAQHERQKGTDYVLISIIRSYALNSIALITPHFGAVLSEFHSIIRDSQFNEANIFESNGFIDKLN